MKYINISIAKKKFYENEIKNLKKQYKNLLKENKKLKTFIKLNCLEEI